MSTKLYDGLRLRDPQADLFQVVATVSKVIREAHEGESIEFVMRAVADFVIQPTKLDQCKDTDTLFFAAQDDWDRIQKEFGANHRFNDPLRFEIVFGRSAGGQILAYPYCDFAGYNKALDSTGLFEEYGYWNNSDQPDELSREQWVEREKEWDSIADAQDTFGSLPTWSLGSTSNPWTRFLVSSVERKKKFTERDLNDYVSPERRRLAALRDVLFSRLAQGSEMSDVFTMLRKSKESSLAFLDSELGKTVPLPERLPESVFAKMGDIASYELPEHLKIALVRFHESLASNT